jgi:hypothetical protein
MDISTTQKKTFTSHELIDTSISKLTPINVQHVLTCDIYIYIYISFIIHKLQFSEMSDYLSKSSIVFNSHFRASSISIQRAEVKLYIVSSSNIITKFWNISNLKHNSNALLAFCTHSFVMSGTMYMISLKYNNVKYGASVC